MREAQLESLIDFANFVSLFLFMTRLLPTANEEGRKLMRKGSKIEVEYDLDDFLVVADELALVIMVVVETGQQSVVGGD